jgi:glycosyltransferase involved in cell wall biosynthesis
MSVEPPSVVSRAPTPSRAGVARKHAAFVTYNGLLDPLGSSQILPYLERLNRDWPVHIVSFERPDRLKDVPALDAMRCRLSDQSIEWVRLRYHKWPSLPATTFDLAMGVIALRRLVRRGDIGLVHARSYVPMAIATSATKTIPLLFDLRGLMAEEYVDGGVWREGELKWRLAKAWERTFFRRAAGAVVLTENIRPHVADLLERAGGRRPLEVIPCCVDLERFRWDPQARKARRAELRVSQETTVFVYSGSLGTWYLPNEMARFVAAFKRRTGRAVFVLWMVNNDEARAREASRAAGLASNEFAVLHAGPGDVPGYLSAADVALALIQPSFSKRCASPTKYAECLAVGLPLVICRDVGDGARLAEHRGAVALEAVDQEALDAASLELLDLMREPREHFRKVAGDLFDVDDVALPAYRRLYAQMMPG